ncbi:MAG: methyltransferase [Roseibium sp.]|nr:methyltransferase [Roseibium sp.]
MSGRSSAKWAGWKNPHEPLNASILDPEIFIRAETQVKPVPHAEDIRLHLADEAISLWQKTEEELGALGLPPPFWAFAWAGGQALARYILDNPGIVDGKAVLDFASGSGLVGIAAMKAGAARCMCVDLDPFAATAAQLNAKENGVEIETVTDDITGQSVPDADIIFSGDVFYDAAMARAVLGFLERVVETGLPVLIGDPGRSYLPRARLQLLAEYTVPVVGALEDVDVKKSAVYRLMPPANSTT